MKLFRGYMYGFVIWFVSLILSGYFFKKSGIEDLEYFRITFTEHVYFPLTNFIIFSFPVLTGIMVVFFHLYFKEKWKKSFRRGFMFNAILTFFYFGNCMMFFMDFR